MLILHTSSLSKYGLNRIFEFAKAAGYDGIEIGVEKSNLDTQNAVYIKKLMEEYGLPVVALHAPQNGSIKSVEHVLQMATFLKAETVVITPPRLLDFKFTSWLKKEANSLRKKKNIQIALLNAPGKTFFGILPERAMNNVSDLKKFGMVALDCTSAYSKKVDLMRLYDLIKKSLVHVHLNNVYKHKEYALPMEGFLPIESLLRKLNSNNYKGAISIRVVPSELSAGDDDRVVQLLKKTKAFVEEFLSK
jgi:sugar phosphate isomerase/epimerase